MLRPPLLWAALGTALLSALAPRPQPGRLAPGLRVAAVPVGGLSRADFERALERATAQAIIVLQIGPRPVALTWDDLGLTLDLEATWQAAYEAGQGTSPALAEERWLMAALGRPRVAPRLTDCWRLAERQLRELAASTPPTAGRLCVPATLRALRRGLERDFSPTIVCPLAPPRPTLPLLGRRRGASQPLLAPTATAVAANWREALARCHGLVVPPGATVCLNALAFPPDERLPYQWAPLPSPAGPLARWGEGCEAALRTLAAVCRQAGLTVTVTPLPERWRALLPTRAEYRVHNPGQETAVLTVEATARARLDWCSTLPAAAPDLAPPAPPAYPRLLLAAAGDVQPMGAGAFRLPAAFRTADLRCLNLEAPLTVGGEPTPYKSALALAAGREFLFRADPDVTLPRLSGSLDVVALANNHALDYGPAAATETVALLRERGIAACGFGGNQDEAAAPAVAVCAEGLKVAFLAFVHADTLPTPHAFAATHQRPGLAMLFTTPAGTLTAASRALLRDSLRRAAAAAEVVVLSLHWGREKSRTVLPYQRAIAREAVAYGADIILGHHPHRLQAVEMLSGHLVCYSLGNCIFPGARGAQARAAVLQVALGPRGQLLGAALTPYRLVKGDPQPLTTDAAMLRAAAQMDLGL